jgi:DNA end-binding protein Ku
MIRPIWRGNISFGLVNIPVNLFTAEKHSSVIHFHLLDKKSHTRIHNQRVNERGQEVPWEDIEHAYEFEKGKYIVVNEKMLEKTAAENYETVEITDFVPLAQIDPIYFAKPYYLMPRESGLKGYVLLHDILQRTKKVGIAKVVIKTREHVAMIMPQGDYLTMIILRYAKELRMLAEFNTEAKLQGNKIKITNREMELAEQLVESMSGKWDPKQYRDNSSELLLKLIKNDIKQGKTVADKSKIKKSPQGAEVVDFMELLKRSTQKKKLAAKVAVKAKPKTTKTSSKIKAKTKEPLRSAAKSITKRVAKVKVTTKKSKKK